MSHRKYNLKTLRKLEVILMDIGRTQKIITASR